MKIFAEPDAAAKRLEELISLAQRNDEVNICREGVPVLRPVREDVGRRSDRLWAQIAEGRPADVSTISNHYEFYDENGLPK
jgi:hypothetical protein